MILSNNLSLNEFSRFDLRVASILEVQDHPNADRLYVLRIDLGEEQKNIVAGIKKNYTPDQLIGRKIIVVNNIEKANIRGVESSGMLLAGRSSDKVILLSPSEDMDLGVRLS